MSIQIVTFMDEHLEEAAALVSARYKALRERSPILPIRSSGEDVLVNMLRGLKGEPDRVVALRGGRLVGFMAGLVLPDFLGKKTFFSPDWANGAELRENRRIYEEMYAHLSRHWVDEGCLIHVVSIFSHDQQGNEAWKWLGFGLSTVDGVRGLKPVEGDEAVVTVKQASLEDAREVAALGFALERHLAEAPTFWIHERDDYEEWMKAPGNLAWLAYQDGEVMGFMALEPGENCACMFLQDGKTINITGAFTLEGVRGRGIASAILNRALQWAQKEGYERCAVDFEAMNVLASRFWMRWFEPVSYSWIRWIDERLRS